MSTDERIAELEITLAHQDAALEELNQTVIRQQGIIDALQLEMNRLKDRVRALAPSHIASEAEETPPPHY
jgi:SlyX protein